MIFLFERGRKKKEQPVQSFYPYKRTDQCELAIATINIKTDDEVKLGS